MKEPRIPRAQRLSICRDYGVRYSSRQWTKLRKRLKKAYRAARLAAQRKKLTTTP
jgi:hypothetical protein